MLVTPEGREGLLRALGSSLAAGDPGLVAQLRVVLAAAEAAQAAQQQQR